ncbi:hypothetical protein K1719_014439 [Acacia pycnantha]|nr:hypothetical protein K1719_014439 [Acacia pycnantha]
MRTKSPGGGRAKTSTKPSHPTARAIPRDEDDAAVPKTSNESNRDLLDGREVGSKDNVDDVIDNKILHENLGHDNICIDVEDRKICIRCNEGGEILVCSESGCPVVVHAKCISCKPKFDDMGKYYCPYCWLKRTLSEVQVLRNKALTAKKDLADFLDNNANMSNKLAQKYGEEKRKDSNELSLAANGSCIDYRSSKVNGSACTQPSQRVEDQQNEMEGVTVNADQHEIAIENDTRANAQVTSTGDSMHHGGENTPEHMDLIDKSTTREKVDVHKISEAHKTTFVEGEKEIEAEHPGYSDKNVHEGIPEDEEEASPSSSCHMGKHKDGLSPDVAFVKRTQESIAEDNKDTRQDREKLLQNESKSVDTSVSETNDSGSEALLVKKRRIKHTAQRHPRRVKNADGENGCHEDEEVTSSGTLRHAQKSSKQGHSKKLTLPTRKRRRLHWTTEEENKLKEGVLKFSKENQNIPWRKILEYGGDVFDDTRTPADLKDKWRTLAAGAGSYHLQYK